MDKLNIFLSHIKYFSLEQKTFKDRDFLQFEIK